MRYQDETTPESIEQRVEECQQVVETKGRADITIGRLQLLICVTDEDGYWQSVNPALEKAVGFSDKEPTPKTFLELVHPDDRELTRSIVQKGLNEGGPYTRFENRYLFKDGSYKCLEWTVVKLPERGSICSVGRDISEVERAEDAVEESDQRFRKIFEEGPLGMTVTGHDYRYLKVNGRLCQMLGYTEQELGALTFLDITHPEDRDRTAKLARQLRSGEIPYYTLEKRFLKKNKEILWVDVTASLIRDKHGRILNGQAMIQDITERKRAERSSQEAHTLLEERVRQRTAELVTMNESLRREIIERERAEAKLLEYEHDLRSLASQLSLAEQQERQRIASELHDSVGQTLVGIRIKLAALQQSVPTAVSEILDESNKVLGDALDSIRSLIFELSPPVLYELGLEAAVESLCKQLQEQHDIVVKFRAENLRGPLSKDLSVFLFQAVRELLINVTKHAQADNAKVVISQDGNDIRITVEDDGVGINLSSPDSNRGFGLFNIRERLKYLGGQFVIQLEPSSGTRAILVAPMRTSAMPKQHA